MSKFQRLTLRIAQRRPFTVFRSGPGWTSSYHTSSIRYFQQPYPRYPRVPRYGIPRVYNRGYLGLVCDSCHIFRRVVVETGNKPACGTSHSPSHTLDLVCDALFGTCHGPKHRQKRVFEYISAVCRVLRPWPDVLRKYQVITLYF